MILLGACANVTGVKIVFMGSGEFACASLEMLAKAHQLLAVVTQPDRPAGRLQKLKPSPVKALTKKWGFKCLQPLKVRDKNFFKELHAMAPEVVVVVAYGQILPKEILVLPRDGCINVHASLLPRYRGAAPVAYAILHGDTTTGVTTMQMEEGLDSGPILLQREEKILSEDTAARLEARLALLGAELLMETLDKLAKNQIQPRPQDHRQATYAKKLSKEDGHIRWTLSAEEIERQIRAFNPWPTAYTFWESKRLQIWSAKVSDLPAEPGVIANLREDEITVGTGKGSLLVTELQREGGRRMKAAEFLRGYPLKAGDHFT